MKTFEDYIDQFLEGNLSAEETLELEKMAKDDPELHKKFQSAKIAMLASEHDIQLGTRNFLERISTKKEKIQNERPSLRLFYLAGVAASIFVLIASVLTINISHSNDSIADRFNPNKLIYRDSESYSNIQYTEAMRAYFSGDYEEAMKLVGEMDRTQKVDNDYAEWLEVLIMLKTNRSKTEEFRILLNKISTTAEHQYHAHGQQMLKWINHPWRTFVVGK